MQSKANPSAVFGMRPILSAVFPPYITYNSTLLIIVLCGRIISVIPQCGYKQVSIAMYHDAFKYLM